MKEHKTTELGPEGVIILIIALSIAICAWCYPI
jgi:hypothetical protein